MAVSVNEPIRQSPGRRRRRWISGYFGTFADLPPDPVLEKVGFGAQLGSSPCAHKPRWGIHKLRIACSSGQVAKGQAQTVSDIDCTRVPPKSPRTNIPSDQH